MKQAIVRIAAAVGLAALGIPASAAQSPVQRHLVYNFSVGVQDDSHDTDASIKLTGGPVPGDNYGSGNTSYASLTSDTGTIDVDVFGVEADGGLVVKVAEHAQRTNRTLNAVTCVVYPTTNTVCGDGQVNPEEMAVLRTLSPRFFDPSSLDAKHHWHEGNDAAGISLDFTAGVPAGTLVPITEDADQKTGGVQGNTLHGTDTYTYDMSKNVATELKEYDTIRRQTGAGQYTNSIIDITATLATDSVTAKN
jgi:hypothetical protein